MKTLPQLLQEPNGSRVFLAVGDGAALVHEEHARIELPPGKTFEVLGQREWSPEGDKAVED